MKDEILSKPLWQISAEEFLILFQSAMHMNETQKDYTPGVAGHKYVYGIQGLANLLGCSVPTASRIKKSGILDGAITQVNRTIVIDPDKALELLREAGKENGLVL